MAVRPIVRDSIHEDYGFRPANTFGEFGGELMDADHLDLRGRILPFQPACRTPGEAVVRAHRISVGDDEDAGDPLGSISKF
jgi:hypothetical protein